MRFKKLSCDKLFYVLTIAIRLVLGCLFLYSGLAKIRQPYDFLSSVYSYELVGPKLGSLTAITLPWLEVLVGVCLMGGIFVGGALLASIGMAAMFTFVVVWALSQGLRISCGCFGASSTETINYFTLIRTVLVLVLSVAAYLGVIICGGRSYRQLPG